MNKREERITTQINKDGTTTLWNEGICQNLLCSATPGHLAKLKGYRDNGLKWLGKADPNENQKTTQVQFYEPIDTIQA